jgi:hypothetical protein
VWDSFYSLGAIWKRASVTPNLRARLAFVFVSKLYRQMYANTGIATDSARRKRANSWARWIAMPCQKLFQAKPMPELRVPGLQMAIASVGGGEIVEIAGLRPDAEPFQILR